MLSVEIIQAALLFCLPGMFHHHLLPGAPSNPSFSMSHLILPCHLVEVVVVLRKKTKDQGGSDMQRGGRPQASMSARQGTAACVVAECRGCTD